MKPFLLNTPRRTRRPAKTWGVGCGVGWGFNYLGSCLRVGRFCPGLKENAAGIGLVTRLPGGSHQTRSVQSTIPRK